MEKSLSNIFKTTNVTKLKVILQSLYRVLQVTTQWKTLKQPVYSLRGVECRPNFGLTLHILCVTLAIFGKN